MLAILEQKARMTAGDDENNAVDVGRAASQSRELGVAAFVNGLRRHVDRVLRAAIRRKIDVDLGARRVIEDRHVEARDSAGVRHPGAAAAGR